jgi:glycosyltransferase involved in cell wall biosynthesis
VKLKGLRVGLIGPLPPPAGGMANQTRQLGELLTLAGATVVTVQVNAPYSPKWVGGVPMLRSVFRLVPYVGSLWATAGRSDVFHIMANSGWSWHLFAAPAVWIARWRGVAVVVNYRGGEAAEFLQRSVRLVQFTMRRVNALIVPSGFLQEVFSRFGMPSTIVPNIIDLSRFYPRSAHRTDTPPHVVVARNLEPLYDNKTAIRAFQVVRSSFAHARLTVAGSGPEEANLRKLTEELGLGDCVHFTGRLDRDAMSALCRSADIVLNPSLADNMPNSLLEAWACGVPVVSTNVGGIPYMAKDGVSISLVPPASPDAMAQACVQLLSDHHAWERRALAGVLEAQRYTWTCVQPVLSAAYERARERALH